VKKVLTRIADRLDALEAEAKAAKERDARFERNIEQLRVILVETHTKVGELHSRFIEQADRSGTEHRDHERRLKLLESGDANGAGGE
jgi:predicted  nucleic acid-binding Zn-ribbon protein